MSDNQDIIKCLQINLCRSKFATTQMINFIESKCIKIVFLQEPYVIKNRVLCLSSNYDVFYSGINGWPKSAILLRKSVFSAIGVNSYSNSDITLVNITLNNMKILLISAYMSPSADINISLNSIKEVVKQLKPKYYIIACDSNARSTQWFDNKINNRGLLMSDFVMENKLMIINNNRKTPTFQSHQGKSFIDLTIINENMSEYLNNWNILEIDSQSDHNYITFNLHATIPETKYFLTKKFNTSNADWEGFENLITPIIDELKQTLILIDDKESLNQLIIEFNSKLQFCCQKVLKKIKFNNKRKSNKWWTPELTLQRNNVCKMRRKYQRCQTYNRNRLKLLYQNLDKEYKKLIDETKNKSWNAFLKESSAENPWGLAFKIAKDKLFTPKMSEILDKDGHPIIDEEKIADKFFDAFFPKDDMNEDNSFHTSLRLNSLLESCGTDDSPFSEEEVSFIVNKQNAKQSPGIDGITADIIQKVHEIDKTFLKLLYNKCLMLSCFPYPWKQSVVKVIPKPAKTDYRDPNAYRPISLIPVFGKILEKLLIDRINYFLHINEALNKNQYGFTPQVSTEDALLSLTRFIQNGFDKKGFVIVLSLDINGAFNSCFWPKILNQLRIKRCPNNLLSLVRSYFSERESKLWFLNTERVRQMSAGCPQGSASGPGFWNISIDDIFELSTDNDIVIECFADDTLIKIYDQNIANLETKTNNFLQKLEMWAKNSKLTFNVTKTNCALFTRKLKYTEPNIYFYGQKLNFVKKFKHLGVIIDSKLSWNPHINYIRDKVSRFIFNLLRFSKTNYGIDSKAMNTIYKGAVLPAICYAVPVWVEAIKRKSKMKKLQQLQRQVAIRYTKAYRTVSTNALNIIADFTPIELHLKSIAVIYFLKKGVNHKILEEFFDNTVPDMTTIERPISSYDLLPYNKRIKVKTIERIGMTDICLKVCAVKQNENLGSAVIVKCDGETILQKKYKLSPKSSVFQALLTGISETLELIKRSRYESKVIIVETNSSSVIKAIQQIHSTHQLVNKIHILINEFNEKNNVYLKYCNNMDDVESIAISAAISHNRFSYRLSPMKSIKYLVEQKVIKDWNNSWVQSLTGTHTKNFFPNIEIRKNKDHILEMDFYVTQALTGHGNNNSYLMRFGLRDNNICNNCLTEEDTPYHKLFECLYFSESRDENLIINPNNVFKDFIHFNKFKEFCKIIFN